MTPALNQSLILTLTGDLDDLAEVAGLAVNLDPVVKELFESSGIEDTIVSGTAKVNEELGGSLLGTGSALGSLGNSL